MNMPQGFTQEAAIQYLSQLLSQRMQERMQRAGPAAGRAYGRAYDIWAQRASPQAISARPPRPYGPSSDEWIRFLGNRYGFNASGQPDVPSYQLPPMYQRLRAAAAAPTDAVPFSWEEQRSIDYKYPYLTPNYNSGYGPLRSWEGMR